MASLSRLYFFWCLFREIQLFSLMSSSAFSLRGAGWLLAALTVVDARTCTSSPHERLEQKSPFSFSPVSAAHCWQVKATCDATSTSVEYCEWFLIHPPTTSAFHMIASCCVLQVPCDWPLQAALFCSCAAANCWGSSWSAFAFENTSFSYEVFSCCTHSVLFPLPCSTGVTASLTYIKWFSYQCSSVGVSPLKKTPFLSLVRLPKYYHLFSAMFCRVEAVMGSDLWYL